MIELQTLMVKFHNIEKEIDDCYDLIRLHFNSVDFSNLENKGEMEVKNNHEKCEYYKNILAIYHYIAQQRIIVNLITENFFLSEEEKTSISNTLGSINHQEITCIKIIYKALVEYSYL